MDGYTNEARSDTELAAKAARRGCQVDLPDDYTIQLDLDGPEPYSKFINYLDHYHKLTGVPKILSHIWYTSAGGNVHVVARLSRFVMPRERMLIQALLGSDLTRERFNYSRLCTNVPNPIALFRPVRVKKPSTYSHHEDSL